VQLRRASNQASIVLGKELGRGGEGAVYPVVGAPNLVAKIYE
jgi:DNA-binding helix-hairpin-helix protein with protein kinase domain